MPRALELAVRRPASGLASALVALVTSHCSLALGYPEVEGENTDVLCADERDQDLDGLVDCADEDCDGQCVEAGPVLCRDGRDNDRDGVIDVDDARCWGEHALAVSDACSSIRGTSARSWFSESAFAPPLAPTELATAPAPMLALAGTRRWVSATTLTGQLDGTFISVEVGGERSTGAIRIGLVAESRLSDPRAGATSGVFIRVEAHRLTLEADGVIVWGPGTFGRSTILVEATLHDGRIQIGGDSFIDPPGGSFRSTLVDAFGATTAHEPLRLVIEVEDTPDAEPWLITRLEVTRGADNPCGRVVPQMLEPALAVARLPSGELCALVGVPEPSSSGRVTSLRGRRSADDGATWSEASVRVPGPAEAYGAAVLASSTEGVAGAIVSTRDRELTEEAADVWLVASADCEVWTFTPSGIGAQLLIRVSPRSLGFGREDGRFVATLYYPELETNPLLRYSALELTGPYEPIEPIGGDLATLGLRPELGLHFAQWGGDTLLLGTTARGADLFVRHASGWLPLAEPLARPTADPGTFDEDAAVAVGLTVLPGASGPRLIVLHDGGAQGICPDCAFPVAATTADISRAAE